MRLKSGVLMIRCLLLGCLLLLSACASQAPLPEQTPNLALPLQLHIQRLQAGSVRTGCW